MKRILILTHRYLGIVLSIFFVTWFASGIGMMYSGGMPELTNKGRLEHLTPLNFDAIQLAPQGDIGSIKLLMVMGRPAYRLDGETLFADTGDSLDQVDSDKAIVIAGLFTKTPKEKVHYDGMITEADQWTIGNRGELPLHKLSVDDDARSQLYISPASGDVLLLTTRRTRALAWVAAIPHWLYFRSLRVKDLVWRNIVIWTSGVGCILAIAGILVGIVQFRRRSPHVPYSGWMWWHYMSGAIFGLFTLTWVFSGLMSMEPGNLFSSGGVNMQRDAFGGALDFEHFPPPDPAAWKTLLNGHDIKEIEFTRVQGAPYYIAQSATERLLLEASPLRIHRELFSTESLIARMKESAPDVPIVESQLLSDYDNYYYSRNREAPLPVLRIKFGDPDQSWFYVDPAASRIVNGVTRIQRVERWIYTGFHDLDFSFWFYSPAWDVGLILLSIGGLVSSMIGLCIGFKRLFRGIKRMARIPSS